MTFRARGVRRRNKKKKRVHKRNQLHHSYQYSN